MLGSSLQAPDGSYNTGYELKLCFEDGQEGDSVTPQRHRACELISHISVKTQRCDGISPLDQSLSGFFQRQLGVSGYSFPVRHTLSYRVLFQSGQPSLA